MLYILHVGVGGGGWLTAETETRMEIWKMAKDGGIINRNR
jgi:hypothetical protein